MDRFSRASRVESLGTSRVSSSIRSGSNRRFPSWRSRTLTAVRPSSASGWRTVVSAGTVTDRLHGVVEADDRAVAGNLQPARRGLLHYPDGHAVVEREDRGRRFRQVEQRRRLLAAAVEPEVRVADEGVVRQDAGAGQRRVVAAQPLLRRDPAQRAARSRRSAGARGSAGAGSPGWRRRSARRRRRGCRRAPPCAGPPPRRGSRARRAPAARRPIPRAAPGPRRRHRR